MMTQTAESRNIRELVRKVVQETTVLDMHTHIYPPAFGKLLLWGVDELLTYHYLAAELFRYAGLSPEEFFRLDKPAQAELIWQKLFIEHSPLSESNRGVLTVLDSLGLDTGKRDLEEYRAYFNG